MECHSARHQDCTDLRVGCRRRKKLRLVYGSAFGNPCRSKASFHLGTSNRADRFKFRRSDCRGYRSGIIDKVDAID